MSKVMFVGLGGVGLPLARKVANLAGVDEIVVCGRSQSRLQALAETFKVGTTKVRSRQLDARRVEESSEALIAEAPDLVVMAASVRSAWDLLGRTDQAATMVTSAGLAVRLPYMLVLPLALMRAVQQSGVAVPVANLCFPDVTGPVLATQGLAPTVGLGNVAMMTHRVRQALGSSDELIRIVGHHAQMFTATQGIRPESPDAFPHVYLGEKGTRADSLPYEPPALSPGAEFDTLTVEASVPIIQGLLSEAEVRLSVPAPLGRPGGYPVRLARGKVALDLPASISEQEAIALNTHWAAGDGVKSIEPDGTLHLTQQAQDAVRDLDPALAAPLRVDELDERVALLDRHLGERAA